MNLTHGQLFHLVGNLDTSFKELVKMLDKPEFTEQEQVEKVTAVEYFMNELQEAIE